MPDMFRVFQIFADDTNEERSDHPLEAKEAVELAKSLTETVAARVGVVKEVRITDSGDACVFQWIYKKGVVFPPPPEGAQQLPQ